MTTFVPAREAAARIGVQPHTLATWRMRGCGPRYTRLGGPRGRVLYPVDELERWLAARTFASTSEETIAGTDGR